MTDEYRIQMQSPDPTKYSMASASPHPVPLVSQPTLGSLENGTSTYNINVSDFENDLVLSLNEYGMEILKFQILHFQNETVASNSGIYRQHSYENNLNSGKCVRVEI